MARTPRSLTHFDGEFAGRIYLIPRPETWFNIVGQSAIRHRDSGVVWDWNKIGGPAKTRLAIRIARGGPVGDLYFPRTSKWPDESSRGKYIKSPSHLNRHVVSCLIDKNGWVVTEPCYIQQGRADEECNDPGLAKEVERGALRTVGGDFG